MELIECLKKQTESSDAKIVHMEVILEGVKREKRYVLMDRRIN